MASLAERLRMRLAECDKVKQEIQQEFDDKDWDYEFSLMNDDEEYSPIPSVVERLSDKTIMDEVNKKLTAIDRDQDLSDLYWQVKDKSQSIYQYFYNIYKTEFLKSDEDLRPSYVLCDDCDFVSISIEKGREHKCRLNPEVAHKRENCRFACNKCKYFTNSAD